MLPVFFDPLYTDGIHPDARFPRHRYRRVAEALAANRTLHLPQPRLATRQELLVAHDAAYVDGFLQGTLDATVVRRIGLAPWTPAIRERTLRLTGGSLDALDHALATGGYAANMAGGTHHAFRDYGAGYCIFNDLAILARHALAQGLRRVVVVDLDVHQGDGTAAMLADEPRAFTFSMHCQANFPFRKQTSDLDVPLAVGLSDEAYLEALATHLPEALDPAPDLVLFQAGVDGLDADRLGKLALTRAGLADRNAMVFDAVDALEVPCVVLMGGGYADPIDPTVEAFADLFQETARRQLRRVPGAQ